jgi:hypothetical protein
MSVLYSNNLGALQSYCSDLWGLAGILHEMAPLPLIVDGEVLWIQWDSNFEQAKIFILKENVLAVAGPS